MGREAKARRIYENRVIDDALTRLTGVGLKDIPLSQSELRTLAVRTRQAIFGSPLKRQRLERYKQHLAKNYGPDAILGCPSYSKRSITKLLTKRSDFRLGGLGAAMNQRG